MKNRKRTIKFFTVANFEKEEQYLEKMAASGWHFEKYRFPFYYFKQGEPKKMSYQIDFKADLNDLSEYVSLHEDAGFQNVFQYSIFQGAWMYFTHETVPNEPQAQLYTDSESLIELCKRIRLRWTIFGAIMIPFSVFPTFTLSPYWLVLPLLLIILYGNIFITLTRKIKTLS
ncbi:MULTISPECIES: DUF2812 domain-containing protein [Listeria]|uniref:DUF2812 domain-containing protein n=1 Tax=Listeria TaxID=1637 RepID=UPI000B59760E|nr:MULTISPECIES: DUF2812 domain-containing protein [Listeria]